MPNSVISMRTTDARETRPVARWSLSRWMDCRSTALVWALREAETGRWE
jgi:hypothetical protein